jgi:hypothetical protein
MVYKTKFLKQNVAEDYAPNADGVYTWELTDQPLGAIWLTVKGLVAKGDACVDDFLDSITNIDVWHGGFNVLHYTHGIKALIMNCKLKQHWPYLVNNQRNTGTIGGVTFPILFGAPYLNETMALPGSRDNRKRLSIGVDVATISLTSLELDICEVILPGALPVGCIKQEEISITNPGTGDHDVWMQTNWDLLKLLLYSGTVPHDAAYTSTITRAGFEIDDFAFGYKSVPWEILHGELMDELEGQVGCENHTHSDPASGETGIPKDLEHWITHYGQMDFFYEKDLKWRAPLSGASTVKLKLNIGDSGVLDIVTAEYVPTAKL